MEKYYIKVSENNRLNNNENSLELMKNVEGGKVARVATIYNYEEFEEYIKLKCKNNDT